ncbi:(2Fe-2S) ferredoxin domain-containing protein [Phormidium sp. CLA17]|uniref:(2Fe-2S) ferredoxin domain-containing protein n=1 Tax=Leptolyngbya sp. Cla-17 TaxID=2803751 RepID=UPI001490BD51|nr:(2Fe-2S) ferredoxin domain-containing protein [Leptolyngbya sp. Cla-17]MBM0741909.1 (2Fe-2S) ferredoxin domain-containing protein [Leptolyngbya sp. Cla-17]
MSKKHKQVSAFSLEGRFLSFVLEDGYKIKRLCVSTAEGELSIKLSKEARASVNGVLSPGSWIGVFGEQTVDLTTGEVKYKAFSINQAVLGQDRELAVNRSEMLLPTKNAAEKSKVHPAAILVCQKSDCMKRGGKALCQALQATLSDRGLQDQVMIKGTGCMKQCKAGPNLVMPDKTRYSRITAREVPQMIDQHFPPAVRETIPMGIAPEHPESTLFPMS